MSRLAMLLAQLATAPLDVDASKQRINYDTFSEIGGEMGGNARAFFTADTFLKVCSCVRRVVP